MGSLERRLQRLESRPQPRGPDGTDPAKERAWTRYFYALENAQREQHGEGPREPTDKEREALELEAEDETAGPKKPPWYDTAAWEEREWRFRCLFAELDRLEETISREETR